MFKFFKNISKPEWYFLVSVIVLSIILTTSPYLYGYFITKANDVFIGNGPLSESDVYVYFSYIEQIKNNHVLLKVLFTAENHSRIFLVFFGL